MPGVSVVIPCYNASRLIASTLASVLSQAGADLDVIVVDDGSTDDSADCVARNFPQVRLHQQTNRGVAAARNQGIALARHDWIAFVDADDLWLPGRLRAQWALLTREPQARMVYTAWEVWASQEPRPERGWLQALDRRAGDPERWSGPSGWIYPELLLDCCVLTSTVLIRRDLLRELGGFDEALKIGEDWDLWIRASRLTPILRVPLPLALYRHSEASLTCRAPDTNYKDVVVSRALARWGYGGPDGRRACQSDVARSQARTWADMAGARLRGGEYSRARSEAWKSLRCHPSLGLAWRVLLKSMLRSGPGRQRET